MKTIEKIGVFSLVLLVTACQINQDPEPPIEQVQVIDEVKAVLGSDLFTPSGKLKSTFYYQGFEFYTGRMDSYYNEQELVILTVGVNAENDTTGASIYGYDALGNQISRKYFDKIKGSYLRAATRNYEYDGDGRLKRMFSGDMRLLSTHYYNEEGLLVRTQFGEDQEQGERYIYEYDESKRISKFAWWGGGEVPIIEYS